MIRTRRRRALLRALGLVLLAACSIERARFTGLDADELPGTATLSVARTGAAGGTVASSPAGIACGATCSAAFAAGSTITLTATPDAGAQLASWSGGGCAGAAPTCAVRLDASTTVTAAFEVARYPVTVEVSGSGAGTVAAAAAGISCPGTCAALIAHGTRLSLTAANAASSQLLGWTVGAGGTACPGTSGCATTITGPTTITATFGLAQALEVTRAGPGGGTVTSSPAGITCGADCSEVYPPGTRVTLTATANPDAVFTGWTGGGCTGTGTCTVDVNGAALITASFAIRKFDLTVIRAGTGAGTVTSNPAGIACGATCTAAYAAGTAVALTAAPDASSLFVGWTGACAGTGNCTVTMGAATSVTAIFTPILHTVSVVRGGAGSGTVTSVPAGITCGADCSEAYAQGAMVTLTATATAGSRFAGWTGGGCAGTGSCVVTVAAATTINAAFTLAPSSLTVSKAGTGAGTVTSSPGGITCGADCTEPYASGTVVTLTATPGTGSAFTGWSGGGCSGTGTCTVTVAADTTVTASFALTTYGLSVSKAGNGAGTVTSSPAGIDCGATCSQVVSYGSTITLDARAAPGSRFAGWTGGGCRGTGPCTVTVTADTAVIAQFDAPFTLTVSIVNAQAQNGAAITSGDGRIDCNEDGTGVCSATYPAGTTVDLVVGFGADAAFARWGGACAGQGQGCSITINADTSTTAFLRCLDVCK